MKRGAKLGRPMLPNVFKVVRTAYLTGRIPAYHDAGSVEYCERIETPDGRQHDVWYVFSRSEAECEGGADIPFDEAHITGLTSY